MSDAFKNELAASHMAPLWEVLRGLTPREPKAPYDAVLWRADVIRRNMALACAAISAEDAERRVLILQNPQLASRSLATTSLYAGIQMILPGEIAPSHKHTASALRLILEGEGGFTSVDGERVLMSPGDFIITPTGVFHDHGATGEDPVMWLDGLDVPVVQMLNAGFSADYPEKRGPNVRPIGHAQARFASGLLPIEHRGTSAVSPLFHYPYSRTRPALLALAEAGEWHQEYGLKLAFSDPTSGASPIRSMGAYMQLLPKDFEGELYRETDGAVFCVVEGSADVTVDDQQWHVGRHDVFVVPSWAPRRFRTTEQCILFSFSDRPLQEHLGFWRAENLDGGTSAKRENVGDL